MLNIEAAFGVLGVVIFLALLWFANRKQPKLNLS
jgi:hypothetical protein